jgi:hypothetical protein
MIETATRYLAGEENFHSVYYAIADAAHAVRMFGGGSVLVPIVDEWRDVADRCRNEFGLATEPISEADFKEWLRRQVA